MANNPPANKKGANDSQATAIAPAGPKKMGLTQHSPPPYNPPWEKGRGDYRDSRGNFAVGDAVVIVSLGFEGEIDSIVGDYLFVRSPDISEHPTMWPAFDLRKQEAPPLESPAPKSAETFQDLPLEPSERIAQLRREGPVAPDGCWIETGMASKGFRQAWYRSREAMFAGRNGGKTKRRYIGKAGSAKHQAAIAAIARRNEINKLKKQIKADEAS